MSHDSMRPKRLKMISKSASSVALLSLAIKSSFLGTSTSACGRSPIISRTSACDLAFFSASRAARSASVRPSSFSLAAAPYATRAVTRSAGCTSRVGDGGQSGKSGGSGNGSSSTCACVILTSSQGRPSASRYLRRAPVATEHPRRSRGVAATRSRGTSTSPPRRRRDSFPRNVHVVTPGGAATRRQIHVAAAASPRLVPAEHPRGESTARPSSAARPCPRRPRPRRSGRPRRGAPCPRLAA